MALNGCWNPNKGEGMCILKESKKEIIKNLSGLQEFKGLGESQDTKGNPIIIVLYECEKPDCTFKLKVPASMNGIPVMLRQTKNVEFL
jgi:hypothetical protein